MSNDRDTIYHHRPGSVETIRVPSEDGDASASYTRIKTEEEAAAKRCGRLAIPEELELLEESEDAPTLVTAAGLARLDSVIADTAATCDAVVRKAVELRGRMRRKRIDSGQKLRALITPLPPAPEHEPGT